MSTIERICSHIASTPERPAITQGATMLTYGELGAAASALTTALRVSGAADGARVAIVGSRSPRLIVAQIACLLLGAAFVPIDAAAPPARRAHLLRLARPTAILDADGTLTASEYDAPVVTMPAAAGSTVVAVSPEADPDRPAYVIFTSGTTGRPKAVVVADRGLDNLVSAFIGPLFDDNAVATVGVLSPFTFDASIKMIYGALATGRTLHIISEDERDDVATIGSRLTAAGVDALDGTPSYLAALTAHTADTPPTLSCILVGGEKLPADLADALATTTGARVVNLYGPTEATVDATSHMHEIGSARVPIGTAIPGVEVRLARNGRIVAVGQPGEIHIGGAGVALGYLDDPELTAERFVIDPFGEGSGRFYRTGDLGRVLRDGTIEYLGRIDEQLKIRGHRIEPAEIERALTGIATIESVGVVAVERHGTQLVAVCTAPVPLDAEMVLAAAADLLPDYMLPRSIVQVDALPLSANGKLDRKAIAALAAEQLTRDVGALTPAAPLTESGRIMLAALRDVLRLDADHPVDLDSSLVALGGDSITAIRLVAALARSGYRTSVRSTLAAPTLARLAEEIVRVAATAEADAIPQAGRVESTPIIADFFSRDHARPSHYHQSILLPLDDDEHERVPAALGALLNRHRILAAFVTEAHLVVPDDTSARPIDVAEWDLTDRAPADAAIEAADHAARLMAAHAWDRGPQLQAAVITTNDSETGARRRELFLAAHHLVVDALSWNTVKSDLRLALADPAASAAAADSTPFRAWAQRLAEFGRSPEAQRDRALWQATILRADRTGAAAAIEAARTGSADDTRTAPQNRREHLSFPAACVPNLTPGMRPDDAARSEEILLAAVARAVEATWGVSEVPLLVESHGRPDDIEALADCGVASTVGWFTTAYPVIASAGPSRSALRRARSALRRVPHGGLTAELLFPDAARRSGVGIVNYLGSLVGGPGLNPLGGAADPGNAETHPFVIDASWHDDAFIVDVSLRIDLIGSTAAGRFVGELRAALESFGADPASAEPLGPVPADHGVNELTIAEFDMFPRDIGEVMPVTSLQAGLLFEHLSSEEDAAREHVVQVSYLLDAPYDADRIIRTMRALFDELPTLRTTFHWEGLAEAHQVVRLDVDPIVRIIDLTGRTPAVCDAQIDAMSAERRSRPFDLSVPTLFVTDVFVTDDAVRITFTHHHIILDGWSLAEVIRRFTAHYRGDAATLGPVPSMGDYLAWARTSDASAALEHWERLFADLPAGTRVRSARGLDAAIAEHTIPSGTDGYVPAPENAAPPRIELRSHGALATRMARVFGPLGVSPSNAVEAALATVLARMNGSQDAVYGVVVSGRDAPVRDIERMVGLFINTVPRRVTVIGSAQPADLARAVRDQALASADFSAGPLSAALSAAGPEGAFDCLFTFENYDDDAATVLQFDGAIEQTNCPLTVTAEIDGEELLFTAIRDPRVLDDADSRRILSSIRQVLDAFVEDPTGSVSTSDTAHTAPGVPQDSSVSGTVGMAFVRSARQHPRSLALVDATRALSYDDLIARAAAVAAVLRDSGVTSGSPVGIADDGVDGVIQIIGAALTGAVYVPLDERIPEARARRMLDQADVRVVLASRPTARRRAADIAGGDLVIVDASGAIDGTLAVGDPDVIGTGDSNEPAYIMYTSGTTGVPKGVLVPHRAVLRLAVGSTHLPFDPSEVVLMTSSLSFDASTLEIWSTLLNGGTLVIGERDDVLDPERVRGSIARHEATTMWLTVSLFNHFVTEDATVFRGLERIIIGGERVSADHVARAYAACPDLVILNGYGPTENTTFTTVYPIPRGVRSHDEIPIGTAIQGTRVIIRDADGRICRVGEPGELIVGGTGVALGYVNDPEGTSAVFEPEPVVRGLRYRTGDRARWLDDGTVDYLGRLAADSQVKVRGFRVEIGEVERALRDVPHVRDAIVRPRIDSTLTTALVAYVVVQDALDQARVRAALAERLPEYMVPAHFVALDAIPLTANGKIDTAALPEMTMSAAVAPLAGESHAEDPALSAALEAFAGALGRAASPDENFFELGGDSIKAIRVVSTIRQRGFAVSVSAVMRSMTARRLASSLAAPVVDAAADRAEGRIIPMPIVTEFLRWRLADPSHFNQDLEVDLTGATTEQIRAAFDELWTRHGVLRAVFDEGALVVRPETAAYPFSEHVVADADADAAKHEHVSGLHAALSLGDGPLFGGVVIRSDTRVLVVLVAHHLVIDAVSWGILADELVLSVHERMSGISGDSSRSTASLRSFASALDALGQRLSPRERHLWDGVDDAAAAALPRFSPDSGDATTRHLERVLSADASRAAVQGAMRAYGASAEELLLAALARAVERVTGQMRTAVRLERHGRSESGGLPATDRTVGWFTTMHPLVVTAIADAGEAVATVKDAARAVPDDGITYGLLPGGYARITTPLTFNYLGDLGGSTAAGFGRTVFNSAGVSVAPANAFLPGVRANTMILDSRFVLRISHETDVVSAAQAERLADAWIREVEMIGEHCAAIASRIRTASDFPDAVGLTRADLRIIDRFPSHVEDVIELTPLQEGMLVHSLDGGTDYVIQQSYIVAEPLRSVLTRSLVGTAAAAVAARHDALRSAFVTDALSHPLQFVLSDRTVPVRWEDLRERDITQGDVDRILAEDVARGLDVAADSLLRIMVLQTTGAGGDEMRLVLTMHHLAVDGWSLSRILTELVDGCRSLAAGRTDAEVIDGARDRRSVTAQPRDQVRWIREQDERAFTAHWGDTLDGYESGAEFTSAGGSSTLGRDDAVDAHGIGRRESMTSSGLRRRLETTYSSDGITVSHLAHAAFGLVLGRESGSDDVVFGSVVSGRDHDVVGLGDAVGLFINTIPVRVRLAPWSSVGEFVAGIRNQALASADHGYGSLRAVEEAAGLHRTVRCLFAFENYEESSTADLGLHIDRSREQTNYAVTVAVRPVDDELAITILYDAGTIAPTDAERITARLVLVLEQFANDPTTAIPEIRTLEEREEREVVGRFSRNELPYDREQTVVDAFLAHALERPNDIAIIMGDAEYDFATVARAARRVAAAVASQVPLGGRVGILTTRSPRTAVAMIGVMMAGCSFVPLDIESPDTRQSAVLADSAPGAILTDGDDAHAMAMRVAEAKTVIRLDTIFDDTSESVLNRDRRPGPDDAAYCIYTSGSTGKPKGVVLTHRGLANLRAHLRDTYDPQPSDRVLQFANTIFDASVWELTLSILSGSALVVVPKEMIYETELLEAELVRTGVTLGLLPPHYYLHLDSVPMRILTTGGGASSPAVVEKARQAGIRYINAFGPSETTVLATGWEDTGDHPIPSRIPIGRPVANTAAFVMVDEGARARLCGVGEVGELCIAGDGVAQGYLGLAEETARAFLPSPFSDETMYRTGDRVRWLHDGTLDFLGRIAESGQVKVRGYRIEVTDVEAGMRSLPGIRDVVVLTTPDDDGVALTAYVVLDADQDPVLVQRALRNVLPGYMIPQHIVPIDVIPLNRSGKLDREALPAAGAERDSARGDLGSPRSGLTDAERVVVDVFQRVLGRDDVDLHDNVFEIGGDSIKAIRIVSALRAANYDITSREVMGAMTPHAIAPLLHTAARSVATQGPVTGLVPPTAMVEQFFAWDLTEPDHFNQDLLLEIGHGPYMATPGHVLEALTAVWHHHDALRAVVRGGRLFLRGVDEAGPFPLDHVSTSTDGLDDALQRGGDEIHRGMDLAAGPLVRAMLVTAPDVQRLLLVAHHLVVDLVSWQAIAEDVRTALDLVVAGETIVLPAKTASLRDWAEALEVFIAHRAAETADHWRDIHRALPEADLRVEAPDTGAQGSSSRSSVFALNQDTTAAIVDAGTSAYACSVEDLVLTAIGDAAFSLTRQERLSVRLESHGRVEHEMLPPVHRTVGWFTTAYPVILDTTGDTTTRVLSTKAAVRAVPDLGSGYPAAVRDLDRAPVTLTLNYLGGTGGSSVDASGGRTWFSTVGTPSAEANRAFGGVSVIVALDRGSLRVTTAVGAVVTTDRWFGAFTGALQSSLEALASHCLTQNGVHRTASDLTSADISDDDLDALNALFG